MINLKKLSFLLTFCALPATLAAETMSLGGNDYEFERIIERKIGPGTTYLRLRFPDYPLNVNMVMVDLNNPYNRIETTVANESAKGTESLVKAAKRLDAANHHPLAAANANFWIVPTQKEYPLYAGITRNASVRNGKMVTESNQYNEKWDKGTGRTGVVSVSYDKVLNIDYCSSTISFQAAGVAYTTTIHQCNKGMRTNEYCMYNSFYGRERQFMPYKQITQDDGSKLFVLEEGSTDGTELLLDLAPGAEWSGGNDIKFIVKEVRTNAGHGTLGNHDLAIVGRGNTAAQRLNLAVGTEVTLKYNWTYQGSVKPIVEQAIGGNALVMRHGELTEHNSNEAYNSQVYSRTGYGCSEDGKTLYIIVIDKSTDPVYGKSGGCNTSKMCEIARYFGCWNMSNFDAGGSAELMVDNAIVNKTTESSPRNVANGWMVFSTAPDDDTALASLAFDHPSIDVAIGGTFTPKVLGYNKSEALIEKDVTDFTLTCSPELGTCEGNRFIAGTKAATGTLTASARGISVSKTITVGGGDGAGVTEIVGNDSQIYAPAKVYMGESFPVTSTGVNMKSVYIYSLNGTLVNSSNPDGSETVLTAPSAKGIYVLNVVRTDGLRESRKLIVM